MKQLSWAAILVTAVLPGLAQAQAPRLVESRVERHQGPPLWISASEVADGEKIVDLDLIDDGFLSRNVEKQRQALGEGAPSVMSRAGEKPEVADIPLSDCKSMLDLTDHRGGEAPSSSLADLATHSETILRGTIASIEPGFSSGVPSSLLEIEVEEVLKGTVKSSRIHVDYLVARFRIGPYSFCNANKGYEPRPGDRVLLFDYTGPSDQQGTFYGPRLDQIFFEEGSGTLALPPRLRSDPDLESVRSLDQVIPKLRSKLGKGAVQKEGAQ